jgi:microcystin-dependent protein
MSEPFLGEIRMVGFNFAPVGWALCNGQVLPISQNAALFSLLGTTFGGDGRTTFALPNLQGMFPMHMGGGFFMGQTGGAASVKLTTAQMPAHSHTLGCNTAGGTQASPSGGYPAIESTGTSLNYAATGGGAMNTAVVGTTGGTTAVPTLPPYLCVNFIIALQGIFPSRN